MADELSRMRKTVYSLGVAMRQIARAGDSLDRADRCDLQTVSVLITRALSKLRGALQDVEDASGAIFDTAAEMKEQPR